AHEACEDDPDRKEPGFKTWVGGMMGGFSLAFVIALAEAAAQALLAVAPTADPPPVTLERPSDPEPPVVLDDISVTAAEPRWVSPRRREKIGRPGARVSGSGKAPFPLVWVPAASHSALTASVAHELGI